MVTRRVLLDHLEVEGSERHSELESDGYDTRVDQVLHFMLESPTTVDIVPWSVHMVGTADTLIMIFRRRAGRRFRLDPSNEIRA